MSALTDDPSLMLEALAVLVKRLGGSVTVMADEAPANFDLLSKWEPGQLHLVLDEEMPAIRSTSPPPPSTASRDDESIDWKARAELIERAKSGAVQDSQGRVDVGATYILIRDLLAALSSMTSERDHFAYYRDQWEIRADASITRAEELERERDAALAEYLRRHNDAVDNLERAIAAEASVEAAYREGFHDGFSDARQNEKFDPATLDGMWLDSDVREARAERAERAEALAWRPGVEVAMREIGAHISLSDVRLMAGEGPLSITDVVMAVNSILKRRVESVSKASAILGIGGQGDSSSVADIALTPQEGLPSGAEDH